MYASHDSTAPTGLRGWWASPPRSGLQRIISPPEYRHLRGFAGIRIAAAAALVGLAVVTRSLGGNDWPAYAWTAWWLVLATAQFSHGAWDLAIDRTAAPRT
jgi:hypothetical protein